MSKNGKGRTRPSQVGVWQMLRDVLIASLNKGQFLPAALSLIFIVMILKMPAQDVSKLVFRLVDMAESRYVAGYVISLLLAAGWFIHSKHQRRQLARELERISSERNHLQRRVLGNRVKSSEGQS